jgi:hypothetical protein
MDDCHFNYITKLKAKKIKIVPICSCGTRHVLQNIGSKAYPLNKNFLSTRHNCMHLDMALTITKLHTHKNKIKTQMSFFNTEWTMAIFRVWIQGTLKMGATYRILMREVLGQFQIDFSQWTPKCMALECLLLGQIFIKWQIIFQN